MPVCGAVAEAVHVARLMRNIKSSNGDSVHAEAFCDLKKLPAYGCLATLASEPMIDAPSSAV
jgi:hypothetical protein